MRVIGTIICVAYISLIDIADELFDVVNKGIYLEAICKGGIVSLLAVHLVKLGVELIEVRNLLEKVILEVISELHVLA
jgi:hypothetical protein